MSALLSLIIFSRFWLCSSQVLDLIETTFPPSSCPISAPLSLNASTPRRFLPLLAILSTCPLTSAPQPNTATTLRSVPEVRLLRNCDWSLLSHSLAWRPPSLSLQGNSAKTTEGRLNVVVAAVVVGGFNEDETMSLMAAAPFSFSPR